MITKKYILVKEQTLQFKHWIMKYPKQVYGYVMIVLLLSFSLIFIQYFYFTPKFSFENNIPNLYSKSDQIKTDMDKTDQKMSNVVNELQQLKRKRENGPLTKSDSLRIEYLFNQYQTLKNEN